MRMVDAAREVLAQFSDGRPMHYRRITEIAQQMGWISPQGLTPEASMNAAITTDVANRSTSGKDAIFTVHGRGFYSSAKQRTGGEVEDAVRRSNETVRQRLYEELKVVDPQAFEQLIGRLLESLGFEDVEVTSYSSDGGIDVRGTLSVGGVTNVWTAIQVKRIAKTVGAPIVQQLRGSLSTHERGLIITLGKISRDARMEASMPDRPPISLVDRQKLIDLLIDNDIGVMSTQLRLLRLDLSTLIPVNESVDTSVNGDPTTPAEVVQPRRRTAQAGRRTDGKLVSLWPLPGGRRSFVRTLTSMLNYVADTEPTVDEFIDWMMQTFPTVKSRKTAIGYLNVPRFSGLINLEADRLMLSADAAECLSTGEADDLLAAMSSRIGGIEETLDRLRERPATLLELTAYLNDLLGTEWTTDAQARWRVTWLESFGKVTQEGDSWFVVPESDAPSSE